VEVRKAAGGSNTAGTGFFYQDGVIYRRWVPREQYETERAVEQLVLPQKCRPTVLQLAHDIPLAGHMGKDKTAQRVLQCFYWPTLFRNVANYCRACPECQKTSTRRIHPAPMVPLPIIQEPFQWIAMDIVGPLPRSSSGKKYVLVVCDYATRHLEAIPLHSTDAEHIAEELVKLAVCTGWSAQ